jgi:hypothetical protein
MRCAGHVACIGEMRNRYKMSVEKPEEKRLLWKHRNKWEDIIKMNLK